MNAEVLDRRMFLTGCGAIGGTALLPSAAITAQQSAKSDAFDTQQDPNLVRRMVGVSHGNIDAVRELLAEDPELAKANWDWGFGDWESALGAASHTGSREIALLLLENGARMNFFCAVMLGELDIVRAFIEARPGIQRTRGPHSLTLMHHARTGGEAAQHIVEYLKSIDDADIMPQQIRLDDAGQQRVFGTYRIDDAAGTTLSIESREGRGGVWLRAGDGSLRQLYRTNKANVYHPAGAERVHVSFDRDDSGAAMRLHIRWAGGRAVVATRA